VNDIYRDLTLGRFLSYVTYNTASVRGEAATPSSPGQWDLAKALLEELKTLGLSDVTLTDHCYVIARLPATKGKEGLPAIGFIAHLDTSEEVSGEGVRPILVEHYDGRPIELSGGLRLDPQQEGALKAQEGKAIVHTDGSTLLGADNKAGIAIIMGAVEYLLKHPEIPHGAVEVIFTPDEETGKGLPQFPLEALKSKACYTIDGGGLGELDWECFNAWSAEINFTGISMHLGAARGRMVNAVLMASAFAGMLPRNESPEATDGYYGYYCALAIQGDVEEASLKVYIRDFDFAEGERRVAALHTYAKAVEALYPGGKAKVSAQVQYYNMKEKILAQPEVLDKLRRAYDNLGIPVREKPIRGGTDGSRLTELGIPTPNVFTGGWNAHSRLEWLSVEEMAASCQVVVELIKLW